MTELISALGGGGLVLGIAAYFIKGKFDDLRSLEKDFDAFRVEVAKQYVTAEALGHLESRMEKRFDKLEAMLNGRSE